MRLSKESFREEMKLASKMTGVEFYDRCFNGLHHIYINQGTLMIAGSLRECYDFMVAFNIGYKFDRVYK